MSNEKKIYAVYRCLYGHDFVKESIESIIDHVDKVFVFYTNTFWGNVKSVVYNGTEVIFPTNFSDKIKERINNIKSDKIILMDQGDLFSIRPHDLYTTLVNNVVIPKYGKPDILVMPEVDHVFPVNHFKIALNSFIESNSIVAKTKQIELWRNPYFRIPDENGRIGTVFWNFTELNGLPVTGGNGNPKDNLSLSNKIITETYHYNLGYMFSEETMYWKHLSAMAFSNIICDSPPVESWYEKKWLNWDYEKNNSNLHMSQGYQYLIPRILKYSNPKLPKSMLEKYRD